MQEKIAFMHFFLALLAMFCNVPVMANDSAPTKTRPDRLSAVDMRDLNDEQMAALRDEAMRRGVAMPTLLGQLVDEVSKRMLNQNELTP